MALLSGTLYDDTNENGLLELDGADPDLLIGDWLVYIDLDASDSFSAGDIFTFTTTSDTDGNASNGIQNYTLDTGSLEGTYELRIAAPQNGFTETDFANPDPANYVLPGTIGFNYTQPDNPPGTERSYIISLDGEGMIDLGNIDFEDVSIRRGDAALNSDDFELNDPQDQLWADLGFQFFRDDTGAADGLAAGSSFMYVERRGGGGGTNAFVTDISSDPFWDQTEGRQRKNIIFDKESSLETESELGFYFLRGGGLYDESLGTIPGLLIEYDDGTIRAEGEIWDIDTTLSEWYAVPEPGKVTADTAFLEDGQGNPIRQYEQWRVTWYDANENVLGTEDSPIGEPVWVPNFKAGDFDNLSASSFNGWSINEDSYDGKAWTWNADVSGTGNTIKYVYIEYIGTKGVGNDTNNDGNIDVAPVFGSEFVGLAFDNFKAFKPEVDEANFGVFQAESNPQVVIGDFVFYDQNGNGIQDDTESGVEGVTVRLLDADGNAILDENGEAITETTLFDGSYQFTVEGNTDYQLQFVVPEPLGFDGFTTQNVTTTTDLLDSDVDSNGLLSVSVGESDDLTLDAGLVKKVVIGDTLFYDQDGDGIQDDGELGV
ncbi:MAG: SdrD B-like domain-containing protein, partial [Microcystaceae cyanobacterium]